MKKIVIAGVVVLVVAGTAVSAYLRTRRAPEPEISTASVSVGDVVQTIGATGTIEPVHTVDVGTQVNGTILEMYADFNDIVTKGQKVAKIDPKTIEAAIDRDKANLESANANLERMKIQLEDSRNKLKRAEDLSKRNLITLQDLETAQVSFKTNEASIKSQEASIKQTQATLNQDMVNLGYTDIYAPINGIIINRKVDVGQTVVSNNAATSMFQIAEDLTKMQLKASIDESDVGMVRPGQRVTFRVDAFLAQDFEGTVSQVRLQPVVTQNVVTYVTIIDVPNPDLQLKPGMTANLSIEVARRENVMRVPVAALRFRPTTEIFEALKIPVPSDLREKTSRLASAVAPASESATQLPAGAAAGIADRGATTIDALFGELKFTDTPGRVWAYTVNEKTKEKSLVSMSVRTGINDGTFAELVQGAGIQEGKLLVTTIDLGQQQATSARSPLMPGGRGPMGGGGHGGPH